MDKLFSYLGIIVLLVLVGEGCAQGQDTSCMNQLAPCLNYINGAKDVPDSCSDPLKNVIKTNPDCLGNMASNQGSRQAEKAGINVTQAQQLPARCGINVNPLSCLAGSPKSKNSVDDSSSIFLLHYWSMMAATILSIIFIFFVVL